jgi:SAM-dependent methyltransferase
MGVYMKRDELVMRTIRSYDECAKKYCKFHFNESFENRLKTFIRYLPKETRVLDVGCGCGRDTKYLIDHGVDTIGIDLSKKVIEEARSYVPNATFLKMDMRNLNFESSKFGGILAMASILHTPRSQVPELFADFRRILRDNGILFVNVMVGSGEKIIIKSAAVEEMGPRFFTFYTCDELCDLLIQSNFSVEHHFVDKYLNADWLNIYARKD